MCWHFYKDKGLRLSDNLGLVDLETGWCGMANFKETCGIFK